MKNKISLLVVLLGLAMIFISCDRCPDNLLGIHKWEDLGDEIECLNCGKEK